MEAGASEYLVAHTKPGHALAYRLDLASELHSKYVYLLRSSEPHHQSDEKWVCFPHAPVCGANRARVNSNKNFVVLRNGFFQLSNFHNIGRPVFPVEGGFHVAPTAYVNRKEIVPFPFRTPMRKQGENR